MNPLRPRDQNRPIGVSVVAVLMVVQRFRKCGSSVLMAKDLRTASGGSMFAMGFLGRFWRAGPGLSAGRLL